MNIEKTNQKLLELYQGKYPKLSQLLIEKNHSLKHSDKATNPLMLKVDEKYANAELKIMFFGQETNYWYSEKNKGEFHGEIEPIFNLYEEFYLSNNCYSYGGQFWNGIGRFGSLLEKEVDKKVGLIWNNVIKIGKCGIGTPFASIQEIQFEHFNVIQKEIEILNPDILVFFSGPNYDGHIKRTFGNLGRKSISGFTERQLCELNVLETVPAFRTYHPNYLWRNDIDSYLNPIVQNAKLI